MKVLLLAGGFGTRLSEETHVKPKPMVEIGDEPILWHIMKIYSHYGFNEFVVLLGYKGYVIKEYFANYFLHQATVTIDMTNNSTEVHDVRSEPWKITLQDTGIHTMTGGRIRRGAKFAGNQTFMLTYGDGVGNINISELLTFHRRHGKLLTVTSVQPVGRFGALDLDKDGNVLNFIEKPKGDGAWINGGFFVCEPGVFDYIRDDTSVWEKEPLENLSKDGQLVAYRHQGFWRPMDTLRDKNELNTLWESGKAPWKIWN